MFFASWELRLRRRLTDGAVQPVERVSNIGFINNVSEQFRRERVLRDLPKDKLFMLRRVAMLKFLFVAILIVEVIVLQR
jgi:hypothetical protein